MSVNRWGSYALALVGSVVSSQSVLAAPKVGDRAPELGIETLLRGPDGAGTTWAHLEGKVVLVEFWATWCAPCVAAFPHLNEIVHAVADRDDIVMIAVSDENRETVESFLKKKKLDTWVALDTDRSAFGAYGIRGIPQTLIVGKDGRIAALTYPMMVTADHLSQVAEGKPINLPSLRDMVGEGGKTVGVGGGEGPPKPGAGLKSDAGEMREYALSMTEPGEAHERIGFLAGQWRMEETVMVGGPGMGGEAIGGTMTWRWSGAGRHLVGTKTIGQDPVVESIRVLGWDSKKRAYYLHEFDPMSPEPSVWSGDWNDQGTQLVFTREQEIRMMGAPNGDGHPLTATMIHIFERIGDSGFEATMSIKFPEDGPKMPGMPGEQVISRTTGDRSDPH